ncbi:MAG: hypothetical protein J3K34DRAFT_518889 [Monoraphidium minutum]|nr:MAG: hypothetical protein J3K34DRAFT_518889 [Monoraphidium minutum]
MLPLLAGRLQPSAGRLAEAQALKLLSGAFGCDTHRRGFHGSAASSAAAGGGPGAGDALLGAALSAFSPAEPLGAAGLSPIMLGTSLWELAHSATGLPWWASIPLTTVALRAALLPLTVKARAATVNFALMGRASAASRVLWERMQQEQQQQQPGGGGGKAMTRNELTKQYFMYMRQQHGTPSVWWYPANAALQINVFLSMSAALRHMSAMAWPGLETEGLGWFADMTAPAVEWGTWVTGYGVAGALLPLGVFGAYVRTLEYTSAADRPRARAVLELLTLPLFVAALLVPHATALYWLANGAFGLGLQAALSRPRVADALGLPMIAVHARGELDAAAKSEIERRQVAGAADASDDAGFVRYLAADALSRGQTAAAAACLKRLAALEPGDAAVWRRLGAAGGAAGQWGAAAEAHEKAGDVLLAAARQQAPAAAGGGSGAAEAGAEFVAAAVAHLNAASLGGGGDAEAAAAAAAGGGKLLHVGRALELLHKASTAGVSDAGTWYYTCMGRLATGQLPAALDAARRSWEQSRRHSGGGGDSGGGGGGGLGADAARLAKPLGALCERLAADAGGGVGGGGGAPQLLQAAALAAEVGAAAGGGGGGAREALRGALGRAAAALEARPGGGAAEAAEKLRELAKGLV